MTRSVHTYYIIRMGMIVYRLILMRENGRIHYSIIYAYTSCVIIGTVSEKLRCSIFSAADRRPKRKRGSCVRTEKRKKRTAEDH